MQAILLSAGQSSRLYPFGVLEHKSMIKMLGKPLLQHTIESLKENGIVDIIIVVNSNNIQEYFKDGKRFGVSINYIFQKEPLGMGDALLCAKNLIKDDFLLLHGYHFDIGDFIKDILENKKSNKAVLLAKEKEDFWKYGVLKVKENKVLDIIEKPEKNEKLSKLCTIGIYYFTKDFLSVLEGTSSEHYSFENALSGFAKTNSVTFVETKKNALFLKYPWDLLMVKDYLLKKIKSSTAKNVKIAKSAEITGEVIIADEAIIMEGVKIKGPAYIGRGVYVGTNAILRNGIDIEQKSVVGANMELKNSLIMENSTTHSGFIGDSVIGKNCKIAAQVVTANVRLDRKTISTTVENKVVDSGLSSLGVLIGDNCTLGVKVSIMPGIIIGNNVVIGPSTTVKNNVPDKTTYYTKFQEVISKNEEK